MSGSPRIVTQDVTITWGDPAVVIRYGVPGRADAVFLRHGTMLDVQPSSALESAIGPANLRAATAAELASASTGTGGGAVSN